MEYARRHHLSSWDGLLRAHREHASFKAQSWAHSREWGFTCTCSGEECEWRIGISSLRQRLPETVEIMRRLLNSHQPRRATKSERQSRARSKTLLMHCLTKQQRLELKKTKAFTMQAADGHTYRITEGSCNNVKLLVEGEVTQSYCVVFKTSETLPVYDLMLAQKLFLENDPEAFKALAYVYGPAGGAPIQRPLNETPPAPQLSRVTPEEVPASALENPQEWLEERLTA